MFNGQLFPGLIYRSHIRAIADRICDRNPGFGADCDHLLHDYCHVPEPEVQIQRVFPDNILPASGHHQRACHPGTDCPGCHLGSWGCQLGCHCRIPVNLPAYLRNPVEYLLTSFILILWFSGVQILIYLSSLQKIDKSIYEAASIDGASSWEAFWKITLPSLSTTTIINAVYTIITLSHFSENKVIKYIYGQTYAVQGGIGYASAMSFLYFFVLLLLLVLIFLVLRPRSPKRL